MSTPARTLRQRLGKAVGDDVEPGIDLVEVIVLQLNLDALFPIQSDVLFEKSRRSVQRVEGQRLFKIITGLFVRPDTSWLGR